MLWLAVIACLLVSFAFSGIEAGILSINRVRLRHRVKRREPAALRLEALLNEPERVLLTGVIVTNLMNIFAIVLATTAFARLWGGVGYFVAFALFLPLLLFVLELLPKSLFRRFPYRALARLSWALRAVERLLSPLLRWTPGLAKTLLPNLPGDETRRLIAGREDFKYFMLENERSGAISALEQSLIQNVVDFHSRSARELMLPLERFPAVAPETSVEALLAALPEAETEYLLIRPERGGVGSITGIVPLFEVLLARGAHSGIGAFARPLTAVPPTEKGPRLLRRLRNARTPAVLVVDGGQPVGLILREALYREIILPEAKDG